jgi:hypothetical protein
LWRFVGLFRLTDVGDAQGQFLMSGDSGRFATGLQGLDAILGGGVFDGGIYIIQGTPDARKTILGNQICFAQAAQGRNALYMRLPAESHARMIGHTRRMQTRGAFSNCTMFLLTSTFDASLHPPDLDADFQSAERILRDISSQGPAPAPSTDLKLTGE